MNYLIDELEMIELDSEIEVVHAITESYMKQLNMLEYASEELVQECCYIQESKLMDDIKVGVKGVKGESVVKKILLFIPRLIASLIKLIASILTKLFGKKNTNIVATADEAFEVAESLDDEEEKVVEVIAEVVDECVENNAEQPTQEQIKKIKDVIFTLEIGTQRFDRPHDDWKRHMDLSSKNTFHPDKMTDEETKELAYHDRNYTKLHSLYVTDDKSLDDQIKTIVSYQAIHVRKIKIHMNKKNQGWYKSKESYNSLVKMAKMSKSGKLVINFNVDNANNMVEMFTKYLNSLNEQLEKCVNESSVSMKDALSKVEIENVGGLNSGEKRFDGIKRKVLTETQYTKSEFDAKFPEIEKSMKDLQSSLNDFEKSFKYITLKNTKDSVTGKWRNRRDKLYDVKLSKSKDLKKRFDAGEMTKPEYEEADDKLFDDWNENVGNEFAEYRMLLSTIMNNIETMHDVIDSTIYKEASNVEYSLKLYNQLGHVAKDLKKKLKGGKIKQLKVAGSKQEMSKPFKVDPTKALMSNDENSGNLRGWDIEAREGKPNLELNYNDRK